MAPLHSQLLTLLQVERKAVYDSGLEDHRLGLQLELQVLHSSLYPHEPAQTHQSIYHYKQPYSSSPCHICPHSLEDTCSHDNRLDFDSSLQPKIIKNPKCLLSTPRNPRNNNLRMAFLNKLEPRPHILSKQEATGRPGKASISEHTPYDAHTSVTFSPSPLPRHHQTHHGIDSPAEKKSKVSPFHVMHPFYLDELQREKAERERQERELRERVERERKKRAESQAKMAESGKAESGKAGKVKTVVQQWKAMGGLGPNLSLQWERKTELHNKMLQFAKDTKRANLEKVKCVPFMSLSHLHSGQRHDSRSVAIEYSRGVPRPRLIAGERVLARLPMSQSIEQISELEKLDLTHLKYMQMMKKM